MVFWKKHQMHATLNILAEVASREKIFNEINFSTTQWQSSTIFFVRSNCSHFVFIFSPGENHGQDYKFCISLHLHHGELKRKQHTLAHTYYAYCFRVILHLMAGSSPAIKYTFGTSSLVLW